jgi:DNA polymerase III epsilon subunit-like protein
MMEAAFKLLEEADAIVHYNGRKFDIPMLNTEFLELQMGIPEPFEQIDLLPPVRKNFRFPSNKLDYICKRLGIGAKVSHRGMELWTDVMEGDKAACAEMKEYNIQDVHLLGPLYDRLLPYLTNHPNWALYMDTDVPVCSNCGSSNLQRRGKARTKVQMYQRLQCQDCGTWIQERTTSVAPSKRHTILKQAKL